MDFIKQIKDWFGLKIKLWTSNNKIIFKQGEIWWRSLGFNIGEEILGKGEKFTRPVLIFKKLTSNSFLGLPLTTHGKNVNWYVEISHGDKKSFVMLNQARILDKKRLTNKMGSINKADQQKVKRKFIEFYGSLNSHPAFRRESSGFPKYALIVSKLMSYVNI